MDKVIENIIYTDNNEPMNYIDIEKEECKEFIQAIENIQQRIDNALLYLKTMEETEDTYELEKILKGE